MRLDAGPWAWTQGLQQDREERLVCEPCRLALEESRQEKKSRRERVGNQAAKDSPSWRRLRQAEERARLAEERLQEVELRLRREHHMRRM